MAYVDWMIRGPKIVTCNCDYGCPCEFNAPPTRETCEGFEAMEIEDGWFGDVRLDGLRFAGTYHWPGPVHEGNGIVQGVIDARATEAQRDALFKILGGEEQEPTTRSTFTARPSRPNTTRCSPTSSSLTTWQPGPPGSRCPNSP